MPRLHPQIKPREAPISAALSGDAAACLAPPAAGWHDHAPGAVERALAQFEAEQAVALERAGQRQFAGLAAREAEAGVVGRVAEQDHRAMAARFRGRQRVVHQRRADAELAAGRVDRQRAQHQRRHAPGADVPQPQRPDQPALRRTAESARPSAGARPSRRRWQVRSWRLAPKQASSSASRATTSEAARARIANGAASAGGQLGLPQGSHGTSVLASGGSKAEGSVVGKYAW